MIKREDVLFIPYLKKTEYTGSHQGMRYRLERTEVPITIEKTDPETGETENTQEKEERLLATVWPEPYNFLKTPEEKKQHELFSFDEDGIVDAIAWMNDRLFYDKELWQNSANNWDQC